MIYDQRQQNVIDFDYNITGNLAQHMVMHAYHHVRVYSEAAVWYVDEGQGGTAIAGVNHYDPLFHVRAVSAEGSSPTFLFDLAYPYDQTPRLHRETPPAGQWRSMWLTRVWLYAETTADAIHLWG